jgi:uncharacterized oligopeptide transporter (OPT) family protein
MLFISTITTVGMAQVSNDLMGDYRNGFLLRLAPATQFYAQMIGTVASGLTATGMFALFADAYPCMLSKSSTTLNCLLSSPSSVTYSALIPALVEGEIAAMIPVSAAWGALALSLLAISTIMFRHFYLRGERAKYREYVPNWIGIALGLVVSEKRTLTQPPPFSMPGVELVWHTKL